MQSSVTLSSRASSSLPPNETRSLPAAEGRWSGREKETGRTSLVGESEVRGVWAGVSSLISRRLDALPRCFFLTGSWEEGSGRARGAESLSEKKAIREHREARLISSQWVHSIPVSAASAWALPKQEVHWLWPSAVCRGALHKRQ